MADVNELLIRIDATTEQLRSELRRADQTVSQTTQRIDRDLNRVDAAFNRINATVALATRGFALFGAGLGTRELIRTADEFKLVEGRIRLVTESQEELIATQERLFQISQQTRTSFVQTADLFASIARVSDASNDSVLQLAETIQMAGVVSGGDQSSLAAGIMQLTQALGSGVLRGEEFNSVMENTPRIAQALAAALGVTTGALRSMAADGKLTADVVMEALLSQTETIRKEFEQMPVTVGQAMQVLNNEFGKYISETDQSLSATERLAQGVILLSKNLDSVGTVVSAVAAVLAGRMASALAASALASGKAAAASLAQAKAGAVAAQQAARRTAAELATAQALQARAIADAKATAGTNAHAFAMAQLAATTDRLTAAKGAHAAATAASSAAMARASVSARGLSAAMALVGGPVGLVVTAVGLLAVGLTTMGGKAKEAAIDVGTLEQKMLGLLDRTKELTALNVKNAIDEGQQALANLQRKMDVLAARMQGASPQRGDRERFSELEAEYYRVEELVTSLQWKLKDLQETGKSTAETIPQELLDKFQKMEQQLERQIALHGQTSEVAKIRYEMERGALKGLLPDQRKRLEGLAAELDAKAALTEQEKAFGTLRNEIDQQIRLNEALYQGADAYKRMTAEIERSNAVRAFEADLAKQGISNPELVAEYAFLYEQHQKLTAQQEEHNRAVAEADRIKQSLMTGTEIYNKKLEVLDDLLARNLLSWDQYSRAVAGATTEMENFGKKTQTATLKDIELAIQGFGRSFEDTIVEAAKSGSLSFKDMADAIIEDLLRIVIRAQIIRPLLQGLGTAFPSLGLTANAAGNAFQGGKVIPFARGGVVDGPTLFPMRGSIGLMGEAGPEAIMPLRRGPDGKLGVAASGGSGGGTVVQIIDQRQGGEPAQVEEMQGPDGMRMIRVLIRDEVKSVLSSGELDRTMRNNQHRWR